MLSIIIPTLNEEKYLPYLLDSIKEQDFKDYEIIVADAGSKDRTLEIAKNFGCQTIKGGLPAKGRNEGAKIAKGDIILFLDADTMLPENSLKDILEEFEKRKLGVAHFLLQPFGEKKISRFLYDFLYNWPISIAEKILLSVGGPSLIRRELHKRIGGFNEDIKIFEDAEYVKRALRFGKFGVLKSTKIFYSQRRFKKEGWAKTYLKYLLAYFYFLFFGPIKSDIFKYRYGDYDNEQDNKN